MPGLVAILECVFYTVHQLAGDIQAKGFIKLPDTGRAGDIDFSQVITNDVQANEE